MQNVARVLSPSCSIRLLGEHNRGNPWSPQGCRHSNKGKPPPLWAHPLRCIYHTCQNQEGDHVWLLNLVLRIDMGCSEECKPSSVECDGRQQRISMGLHADILGKDTVSRILVKMSLGLKNARQQPKPLMDSIWTNSAEATVPSKSILTVLACSGWTVQKIGVRDLSRYSLSWLQHAFREKYAVRCWRRREKSDLISVQK